MPQSATRRVVLAMISAICATLITSALDTSPTVSLIGATLAATVPALVNAGGLHGMAIGIGVTAAAVGVTYVGFTAADAATDRPPTFPLPQKVEQRVVDPQPTVPTTGEVEVADVLGKQYAEAEDLLRGDGLNVERKDVESDEPPDTVVDQDPHAGTHVQEQTTVTLSVPPTQIEVPYVIDQTEESARSKLEEQGFQVVVSPEVVTNPAQVGVVIRQSPASGAVAAGTLVTLTVGAGP